LPRGCQTLIRSPRRPFGVAFPSSFRSSLFKVLAVSIVADPVAGAPVNEFSELLRSGPDGFEQLLNEVFADMESMCRTLDEQRDWYERRCQSLEAEKQRLSETLQQRPVVEGEPDPSLHAKLTELEHDREALEQELEEVRHRAADLAKTLTEQKRQTSEERAEWTAELRQLRRVLDKQASWIAQQPKQPSMFVGGADAGLAGQPGFTTPMASQPAAANANGNSAAPAPANRDPVLGSVLSQFELLRKDLERRRSQSGTGGNKNVNAS
jgi:hypothetical protein